MTHLLRPYWPQVLMMLGIVLIPALAQAWLPTSVIKPLFDRVLSQGEYQLLGSLLGLGAVLMALVVVGNYVQEAFIGYLSVRIPRELREQLHGRLLGADLDKLPGSAGAMAGRILGDLRELEHFVFYGLGTLVVQSLSLLALLGQMLWRYPGLTLYLLVSLPLLALVLGWIGRRVTRASSSTQAEAERLSGRLVEGFGRLELIRALGLESFARERFEKVSGQHYRLGLSRSLIGAGSLPLSQLLTVLLLGLLLWLGIAQVQSGILSTGDLTAFLTLLALALTPLQSLSKGAMVFAQAEGAASRIIELLTLPQAPAGGTLAPAQVEGRLELRDVDFAYGTDEAVLKGLNLEFPPNAFTALVGPSGAGKSSVLRLLLGLHRPNAGEVLLDGQPLLAYQPALLRRKLAWVAQEPLLFGGTIAENLLAMAPAATPQQMLEVLDLVRLSDELPQGLQTELAEEGSGLSVGQRQRLAIAAALLRDARIILLDEVTSALDTVSEGKVLAALETARVGRTLVVVAHRLSTVRHAERIVVLQAGRIAEIGKHDELLVQNGLYAALWREAQMRTS